MLCEKLFSNIVSSPHDKLAELLHAENRNSYNLRHNRKFNIKRTKTNRFKDTNRNIKRSVYCQYG